MNKWYKINNVRNKIKQKVEINRKCKTVDNI